MDEITRTTLLGLFFGTFGTTLWGIIGVIVKKNSNNKLIKQNNTLLKTGIIVSIGLAIHNFPGGLAIGSGFDASIKLGLKLALAICLHEIPEGRFQSRYKFRYA